MQNERLNRALGEKFSFKVANASGSTVVIALLAAFFNTLKVTTTAAGSPLAYTSTVAFTDTTEIVAAGHNVGAVADDGTVATGVTCTAINSKMSIRQFREYVKNQALLCTELTIQANNKDQFEKVIEVIKATPLTGAKSEYLTLSEFRSVDQQAEDKIVIKNLALELAFDTLMMIAIDTGRDMTFTFKF